MINMVAQRIAEAGALRAFFNQGDTPYLLITFNDAGDAGRSDGSSYWGAKLVEKNSISCIGIVSTKRDWYDPDDMESLCVLLRPYIEPHTQIITYGNSMGGYAALRFSGLLKATHVIAVAPQASIDPEIVNSFDIRFRKNFIGRGGKLIKSDDISGKVWVAYDPRLALDVGHVELISEACPAVRRVAVPYTGHNSIFAFRGSQQTQDIISAVLADDLTAVNKLVHKTRRNAWQYAYNLANYALAKRPKIVLERIADSKLLRSIPLMPRMALHIRCLINLGRPSDAQQKIIEIAAAYPLQAVWHSRNISSLYASGAYLEAEAAFEEVMRLTKGAEPVARQQERIYHSANRARRLSLQALGSAQPKKSFPDGR
ncbi:hypothetical protein [Methylobacterium sp. WCS2018Hpa-22]|uniref:hypothetical protein n=1 Tax=Methylobacterium sp. WCS2018Hpa-22 TaxID=3073633 RepID=UPI00288B65FE|nr:hypothetical protein [Methylobacterium sp. WCS2018Hpa-22]